MRSYTRLCVFLFGACTLAAQEIVVYGGTPGGIAAAIAAGRLEREVCLVEYHDHIGGMTASGLGKSDIENRAMIGGVFNEFVAEVYEYYVKTYGADHENVKLCHEGYYSEPKVAEMAFESMLAKLPKVTVLKGWRLQSATMESGAVTSINVLNRSTGESRQLQAKVFIDATYEGDLYAAAGAEFRLGRESRDEFGEPHAGVIYFDYQTHEFLPGTTGAADDRLPAYTYRLCLTTDSDNSRPMTEPPPDYDRNNYLGYFDDLKSGRLAAPKVVKPGRGYNQKHFGTLVRALSVTDLPNGKTDVNINPRPLGFPFAEENRGYIEGDDAVRQRISARHRNLALGLLWFLQNDPEVPDAHRALANELHLPKDEFTDNSNFPWQLYVREGRRLVGEYTLTQQDITGKGEEPIHHPDTIAVGEFPIDSFPTRKRQPGDTVVLEGYLGMLDYITRPYEIPYRIMVPKKIDALIVPVAASTTHVAFSSIRMEPTWMCLGQAAGVAAHLAIKHGTAPRTVPIEALQSILRDQMAVLNIPNPISK
ncbi:MAG: FAD-dependent oxidoreductase [Candidatus Hydrogenedentes bacterium]|nr:FAD-dependent oxidoreductase [Candidatus Hydrogenedentota bacterium]